MGFSAYSWVLWLGAPLGIAILWGVLSPILGYEDALLVSAFIGGPIGLRYLPCLAGAFFMVKLRRSYGRQAAERVLAYYGDLSYGQTIDRSHIERLLAPAGYVSRAYQVI